MIRMGRSSKPEEAAPAPADEMVLKIKVAGSGGGQRDRRG